ncbi:DUF6326 family protein [Catellatospora sp. KI3]|uniref:DUF6326 family protein n=1 Tax=Catellatospora sp. KI3 TaxID=3041620 RepID=UPI002482F281|nr:DUF6326 family protein [Catellatospora sp. KI3]MDI1463760.1 DUF6326 family protein [Catellatospora sp. KI3]
MTQDRFPGQDAARGRANLLSTLWIFVVLNYLYCDVLGHMDGAVLAELLRGEAGGMRITQGFLFGAGVLMEIPIAMVLLARVLPDAASRWANTAAAAVMTAVQAASLAVGVPTGYYVFYSVIEIACTAFIAWYAWTWRPAPRSARAHAAAR